MAVQKKNEESKTLESGLDFWSRQEQQFQSLFGKEALKDKEFLKMKLRYYDSLWYQYKNAPLGIEGQLLRNMLKFQRKKLEKSLHRGLLRQIIRRINTAMESGWALKAQRKAEIRNRLEQYNQSSPKPQTAKPSKQEAIESIQQNGAAQDKNELSAPEKKQENSRRNKFYGYNYHIPRRLTRKAGKGLHH